MAQIANIVLNVDSTQHTFSPYDRADRRYVYVESSSGESLADQNKVVLTGGKTGTKANNRSVKTKVEVPFIWEDLNGNKERRTAYANVEFVLPNVAPTATITLVRKYVSAVLADNQLVDAIDAGQNPY